MSDPVEVGLGECDVPISIQNVKVTPIPGKYPFRVHTFINNTVTSGPSFTAVPAEQDIYWMDIAVHEFSSVEVWATSREEEDTDIAGSVNSGLGYNLKSKGPVSLNDMLTKTL